MNNKMPWSVSKQKNGARDVYGSDMRIVCSLHCKTNGDLYIYRNARANANLIAAAPELLEALEAVVKSLLEYESYSTTAGDAIKVMMRAKGESNENGD